jgi:hypothetical protein
MAVIGCTFAQLGSCFSILDCDHVIIAERTYHNKVRRTILTVPALFLCHSLVSSCSTIFY